MQTIKAAADDNEKILICQIPPTFLPDKGYSYYAEDWQPCWIIPARGPGPLCRGILPLDCQLPDTAGSRIDSCILPQALIHGYVCEWLAQKPIVDRPGSLPDTIARAGLAERS